MRKVVQVNGKNIYVYRKGHEKKHLGRTFVKYWKDGKVQLPSDGNHRLQVDKTGKIVTIFFPIIKTNIQKNILTF